MVGKQYEYQLLARCDRDRAYNLPDWYSFGNISPAINRNGNVAFKVLGTWQQGIWYGNASTGRIIYTAPRGVCLSNVSLNDRECLVWEQLRSRTHRGIWQYAIATEQAKCLTAEPDGSRGWTAPTLNNRQQVSFRAKLKLGYSYACYDETVSSSPIDWVTVSNLDEASIYSYLFLPSFNNRGEMAAKVRLGEPGKLSEEQPDQIRIFTAEGNSTLVLSDAQFDADSPFRRFDNSIGFNDRSSIAFIASLNSGKRGIFYWDGMNIETIALEGEQVGQLERFPPRLNNRGWVVFRAFNLDLRRGIWLWDGTRVRPIATEGDIFPTDIGDLRLARGDNEAVFSGTPAFSDRGEIVFAACLSAPQDPNRGYGAGLFKAIAA